MSGGISGAAAPIMPISASSFFLDRRMGRSTPDSEALASSDDEHEPSHMTTSMISNISTRSNPAANGASSSGTLPRPTRRPSWLSEIQPNYPRQGSRPQTSASVAVDNGTPSPTTAGATSSFPFTIPLQPTLKPHRSASYSVGQLEAHLSSAPDNHQPSYTNNNHTSSQAMAPFVPAASGVRNNRPVNALTRRASRLPALPGLTEDLPDTTTPDSPQHLSGFSSNDMESSQLAPAASGYPSLRNSISNTGLRRQVTLENANRRHRDSMNGGASGAMAMNPQLRAVSQMAASEQTSSGYTDYGDTFRTSYGAQGARRFSENAAFQYNMPNSARDHWATSSVTESVDDINSEQDIHREINRIVANEMPGRTMSMSSHRPGTSHSAQLDYDNLPAALARSATLQDQASAVYDDEDDSALQPLTRSATHSAAFSNQDMRRNLRSASIADISSGGGFNPVNNEFPSPRTEIYATATGIHAENYFNGVGPYARGISNRGPDAVPPNPYRPRVPEPHRVLCIVQFKLARVEIYYFYDTMHLELKVGDMVIVEGDRGHDLGTLAHIDVSPEDAVKFRKEYANKHYQYLLMFSEHQRTSTTLANAPPFAPVSAAANASRQGPQSSQPVLSQRDSVNPKQIRRKAESHEIGLLREKERNETKAKRLCQTKANEMGLNMEVLDAEFQIDFQKLTFFYYAPSYVNFGNLVTDLFKVYKARIWMSAVNPESFQQNPNIINDNSGFGIAVGAVQRRGPPTGQRSRGQPALGGLSNAYMPAATSTAPVGHASGYGAPSPTYGVPNGAQQFGDWQGFYAPPGYEMYQPQAYTPGYAGYDPSVWRVDRA